MNREDPKHLLVEIYRAALAAADPGPVLIRALQQEPSSLSSPSSPWIIALGKAARPMAEAAVRVLADLGQVPAGGLVVTAVDGPRPHASLACIVGDHPEPGAGSLAASDSLDRLVKQVSAGDTVWVLLSGGTSSLIGAPQPGITAEELKSLFTRLLRSGLDIKAMNRVRKRFTRWSAGRLARSLAHARVCCYIISDVVGDDLAAIGSGPCVPDVATAHDVRETLVQAGLLDGLAPSLQRHLDEVERGGIPETPKPGDPAFAHVENRLIASNRLALEAASRRARELALIPEIVETPLEGEAAGVGAWISEQLVAGGPAGGPMRCLIAGGETTVTLTDESAGRGGRSQELALAASRSLCGLPAPIALLAAGTDGRDGPTDAAGALVDGQTWDRIAAAGRDPQRDLRCHDSYAALDAVNALIKTGPTGTNVMDVVIGIR